MGRLSIVPHEMSSATKARGPYAKTAHRKQQIIEAATSVFAASGYHGGSLRDISRELGVSLTSLVHHFGTKSELLIAVLENADHTGTHWLQARSIEAGARVALSEIVAFNFSRPELLRLFTILSSEASAPDHPAHEWFVARYDRVITSISAQMAHDQSVGRIAASVDPLRAAKLLVAGWDGLQLQWLLNTDEDMSGEIDSLFMCLVRGD